MGKLLIAGIVLFSIGNEIGNQDVLVIGCILLVIAIARFILRAFSGVGSSSRGSFGDGFSSDYWSSYSKYKNSFGNSKHNDDYIEAVRRSDPRYR